MNLKKFNIYLENFNYTLLFLVFLTISVALYYFFFGLNSSVFEMEVLQKLTFLNDFNSLSDFFPGQHQQFIFYGHPGLHQFLLYLTSLFFGKSFLTIKIFNIIFTLCTFIIIYKIINLKYNDFCMALLIPITFTATPFFVVHSFNFYQDIPALFMGLVGCYFYLQDKHKRAVSFLILSALILESSIAFTISILLLSFWKHKKINRAYLLPLVVLVIFFSWEFFATGYLTNAMTANYLRLENKGFFLPIEMIQRNVNFFVTNYRFYLIATSGLFLAAIYLYYNKGTVFFTKLPKVLIVTVIQYLIFYIYLNELCNNRDLFIVELIFILCIYLFIVNTFPNYSKYLIIFLVHIAILKFYTLDKLHYHDINYKYQLSTKLNKEIKSLGNQYIMPEGIYQQFISRKLFGLTPFDIKLTENFELATLYINFTDLVCYYNRCSENDIYLLKKLRKQMIKNGFFLYSKQSLDLHIDQKISFEIFLKQSH